MRMFAGPNGSGKSSLKALLPGKLQGIYLNPDEIELVLRDGLLTFSHYGLSAVATEAPAYLQQSVFLKGANPQMKTETIRIKDGSLDLGQATPDSYVASALCEFMRSKLLEARVSFTFETVMSHEGKVDLFSQAQALGYRTHLYYVATEDPEINYSRVDNRVRMGGHPVPRKKIEERYYRSLNLLIDAIRHSNRAYIFDNSSEGFAHTWIAKITEGSELELISDQIPAWLRHYVIDRIKPDPE